MKFSISILILSLCLVLSGSLSPSPLYANIAPVLNQPIDVTFNECAIANLVVTATDADGNALIFSKVAGPSFVFVTTTTPGTGTGTGNVSMTPSFQDATCAIPNPTYTVTVQVTDGSLSDTKSFTITLHNCNRPPVGNAGGPYAVCLGQAVNFNGSASDPDGDTVTFSWNFGDGSTGSGATPSHVYANPGSYTATLTATDNCTPPLSHPTTTTVTVTSCQATISRCPSSPPVNLNSAPDACFYIEPIGGCFNAGDISLPTVVMKYGSGSISTVTSVIGLSDFCPTANGTQELEVCFSKTGANGLNALFSLLPNGTTNVNVTIEGSTTTGCKFQGNIAFDVKKP